MEIPIFEKIIKQDEPRQSSVYSSNILYIFVYIWFATARHS